MNDSYEVEGGSEEEMKRNEFIGEREGFFFAYPCLLTINAYVTDIGAYTDLNNGKQLTLNGGDDLAGCDPYVVVRNSCLSSSWISRLFFLLINVF